MALYKQDPNNSTKQVPDVSAPITRRVSHAINPAPQTITDRPTYVVVNRVGNYSFAYESGSYPTEYVSGSSLPNAASGPIKLDISPVAWGSTTQATGDVTFVYVRVR